MKTRATDAIDVAAPASAGRRRPRQLLLVADILAGIIASETAYLIMALRSGPFLMETAMTAVFNTLILALALAWLAWSGEYSTRQRISRLSDTGSLTRHLLVAIAVASLLSLATKGFFTGITEPSRLALGSFLIIFWILGVAARFSVSAYQRRLFAQGVGVRKIMVLGTGPEADAVMEFVQTRPWLGVVVAGRLCLEGTDGCVDDSLLETVARTSGQCERTEPPLIPMDTSLDGLRNLDKIMRALGADEVVVALEPEESGRLPQITSFLSLVRVPFKIVPSLFEETAIAHVQDEIAPVRVLDMVVDTPARLVRVVKRTSDVCLSLLALLLLIPTGLPIALAILVESGRPVFYKQERIGMYGRRFSINKFRTMVTNADTLLDDSQEPGRGRRAALQDGCRPSPYPGRRLLAPLEPGRAATVLERPQGRYEHRRPTPAAPARGGAVRVVAVGAAQRQARYHRPLAGVRTQEPHLRRHGTGSTATTLRIGRSDSM